MPAQCANVPRRLGKHARGSSLVCRDVEPQRHVSIDYSRQNGMVSESAGDVNLRLVATDRLHAFWPKCSNVWGRIQRKQAEENRRCSRQICAPGDGVVCGFFNEACPKKHQCKRFLECVWKCAALSNLQHEGPCFVDPSRPCLKLALGCAESMYRLGLLQL